MRSDAAHTSPDASGNPLAGLTVLQRGWLSSNNVLIHGAPGEAGAVLVDAIQKIGMRYRPQRQLWATAVLLATRGLELTTLLSLSVARAVSEWLPTDAVVQLKA